MIEVTSERQKEEQRKMTTVKDSINDSYIEFMSIYATEADRRKI